METTSLTTLSGIPITESPYIPPGKVFFIGDTLIAPSGTVAAVMDTIPRTRFKRFCYYLKMAFKELRRTND